MEYLNESFDDFINKNKNINEAKTISSLQFEMGGKKLVKKINIDSKIFAGGMEFTVTGFGNISNAFKEFDVEDSNGDKMKLKITTMHSTKIELLRDPNKRFESSKAEEIHLDKIVLEKNEFITEMIDSKERSKVVSILNKSNIKNTIDYEYFEGRFIAKNIKSANKINKALENQYNITIQEDNPTKKGGIPFKITK